MPRNGRVLPDDEIAKKLKLTKSKKEQISLWLSTTTSSLEAPVGEEEESKVMDLLEDESSEAPDVKIKQLLNKERVDNLLDMMTEREREILDMRFGLISGEPQTLAEVAEKLGVSRERVRQIEEAALLRLRKFVKEQEKEL